jgi:hypothetical protein
MISGLEMLIVKQFRIAPTSLCQVDQERQRPGSVVGTVSTRVSTASAFSGTRSSDNLVNVAVDRHTGCRYLVKLIEVVLPQFFILFPWKVRCNVRIALRNSEALHGHLVFACQLVGKVRKPIRLGYSRSDSDIGLLVRFDGRIYRVVLFVPSNSTPSWRSPCDESPPSPGHGIAQRSQKIRLGEMRSTGLRSLLVYCGDYRCAHSVTMMRTVGRTTSDCLILSPYSCARHVAIGAEMSGRYSIGNRCRKCAQPLARKEKGP